MIEDLKTAAKTLLADAKAFVAYLKVWVQT